MSDRERELKVALADLAAIEPTHEDCYGNVECLWCDAERPSMGLWGHPQKPTVHEHDCAWIVALRAAEEAIPPNHKAKRTPMSLPPMDHEQATTLAQQAALMGSEMWDIVTDDELAPLMDHVLSALIYLHGYAQQVENRLVELLDSNKALTGLLEARVAEFDAATERFDAQINSVRLRMETFPALDPLTLVEPGHITGVAWHGESGTYFDNMEEINRGLAEEISRSFSQAIHPSNRGRGPSIDAESVEIDPTGDHSA